MLSLDNFYDLVTSFSRREKDNTSDKKYKNI